MLFFFPSQTRELPKLKAAVALCKEENEEILLLCFKIEACIHKS